MKFDEGSFNLSPALRAHRMAQDELVKRVLREMNAQTDAFLERCMRTVFPEYVINIYVKYLDRTPVKKAMADLCVSTGWVVRESLPTAPIKADHWNGELLSAPPSGQTCGRVMSVYLYSGTEAELLIGRQTFTTEGGKLKCERKIHANPDGTLLSTSILDHRDDGVRAFLDILRQEPINEAVKRFALFYGPTSGEPGVLGQNPPA